MHCVGSLEKAVCSWRNSLSLSLQNYHPTPTHHYKRPPPSPQHFLHLSHASFVALKI